MLAVAGLAAIMLRRSPTVIEPPKPLTAAEVVAKTERSVAMVQGATSSGTGFVVAPGLLVTNAHVIRIESIKRLKVHFPADGPGAPALSPTLVYEDASRDLAVLRIDSDRQPLTLAANYHFRRGEDIIVVGSPGFAGGILQNAVSKGVMSSEVVLDGQPYYQLGIAVNPGNSGGPVLDEFAHVLGVVTLKAPDKESLAFCIRLDDLRKSIERAQQATPWQIESALVKHHARRMSLAVTNQILEYGDLADRVVGRAEIARSRYNWKGALSYARHQLREETMAPAAGVADVEVEIEALSKDEHLPMKARDQLRDLWLNFRSLQAYVLEGYDDLPKFRSSATALVHRHVALTKSLNDALDRQDVEH